MLTDIELLKEAENRINKAAGKRLAHIDYLPNGDIAVFVNDKEHGIFEHTEDALAFFDGFESALEQA